MPYALAPGSAFFGLTWAVGFGIARLTGAAAVVLVLAATVAGLIAALLEGGRAVRRLTIVSVTAPALTTVGERVAVIVGVADRTSVGPLRIVLRSGGRPLGEATVVSSAARTVDVRFPEPGVIDVVSVDVETGGTSGLVWWRRRFEVHLEPILVAPRPVGPMVPFIRSTETRPG